MRLMAFGILGVVGGLLAAPAWADDAVIARWIQFAPNAEEPARPEPQILARALTTDDDCPSLAVDGVLAPMEPRFVPDPPTDAYPMPVGTFPITECEAKIPPGHATATIDGVDLKLPVANPKRILVIADTGCRMAGAAQQDCQNPVAFPLALMASYEVLFHPDLIVHVGDYFYRDTGCPNGSTPATCPNTTTQWGDNWASWKGDFFGPAKTLLAAAPWIMTRGNHESCGRGANGWYHLLDPRPFDAAATTCAKGSAFDFSPIYAVPAGGVTFLVHDSSFATDQKVDPATARKYATDLKHALDVLGDKGPPAVFTSHKPVYGMVKGNADAAGNLTEQYLFNGLFDGATPSRIALFLSGHIHLAEYVNFQDHARFAPQLVVGVGGSLLDAPVMADSTRYTAPPDSHFTIADGVDATQNVPITGAYAQAEFGFAVLDATEGGFLANLYNINGQRAGRCVITFSPRNLDCAF